MPIDPRISLGYQPPQIESPVNMMLTAQKMQSGQQENALRQAQMENYQAEAQRRNALLPHELAKAERDAAAAKGTARKTELSNAADKAEMYMRLLPQFASDPDSLGQWLTMQHNDPDMAGTPVHDQSLDVLLGKIPRDPQGFATHVQQTALGIANWTKENKPVNYTQNLGGSTQLLSVPGLGGSATVVPGSKAQITASPDARARLAADEANYNPLSPAAIEMFANQIAAGGQMPTLGMGQSALQDRRSIFNRAAQLSTGGDVSKAADAAQSMRVGKQNIAAEAATVKAFSAGPQGNTVRSFNTAINHLDTLDKLGQALQNNDIRLVNTLGNAFSKQLGTAAITNFDTAKTVIGGEVAKALTGSTMALADREEIRKQIVSAGSPAQLAGVIGTIQELIGGQLSSLQQQYETGANRKDFGDKLSPAAKRVITRLNAGTGGNTSATPMTNAKGWTLHTDANGNQAYVSPDGTKFEEVGK